MPKQQSKPDTSGKPRRRGNIYDRLEDARARRAAALSMPAVPANDPAPTPPPELRPVAKPLLLTSPVPAAIDVPPVPVQPTPRRSPLRWHLLSAAAVLALFGATLALRNPTPPPSVFEPIASLQQPAVTEPGATVPAFSKPDAVATPARLQLAQKDGAPKPVVDLVPTPVQTSPTGTRLAPPVISGDRPRPNPRREDAAVSRDAPTKLLLTDLDTLFVQPAPASLDMTLSVNVPANVSRRTLGAVEERLALLGLVPPSPKRFSFNVTSTHVRYYHEADRDVAQELAKAFDAPARDFTDFSPAPDQGFVELWVQGQPPRPARPEPSIFDGFRRDLRQMGTDLTGAIRSIGRQRSP